MQPVNQKRDFHIPFWVILLIAAVNGLVYVFLVPPWQNNDEMGQLEYAKLVAHLGRIPQHGEYNQSMRREILASMIENNFFVSGNEYPNLITLDEPLWIGPEQVGGLPVYYILLSFPLRLCRSWDIVYQLYLARLFSWFFYLLTIVVIRQLAFEVIKDERLISMTIVFSSLLPGFVSKMVAVNDDVAAIFFMTVYIWFSTRLIIHRLSIVNILGVVGSLIIGFYTKQTTWSSVPLLFFVVLFGVFRQPRERLLVGTLMLIFFIGGMASLVSWQKTAPAQFYPIGQGEFPLRDKNFQRVKGDYTLKIDQTTADFYQIVDFSDLNPNDVKYLSLGFWAWSTQSVVVNSPKLILDNHEYTGNENIEISQTPEFYRITYLVDRFLRKGVLRFGFRPLLNEQSIYLDCILLVPGVQENLVPTITDEQCQFTIWGIYTGKNLIRNGSFERGWPVPKQFVVKGPISLNHLTLYNGIFGLVDPIASVDYLQAYFRYLFMTFWGRFGWGTIPFLGDPSYFVFIILLVLSVIGYLTRVTRKETLLELPNRSINCFFVLLVLAQFVIVYLREAGNWYARYLLLPQARYFFPVIFPVSVFLTGGWYNFIALILPNLRKYVIELACLIPMLTINVWAWISIWSYFYK